MNLSKRRQNETLWTRLSNAIKPVSLHEGICQGEEFQLELAKEISRSNRRQHGREFALVHFPLRGRPKESMITEAMLKSFQHRIRISDTIGWHSLNLAVLLPETDRKGAMIVVDDLVKLGAQHGVKLEASVYTYPWDDELISVSNEIARSQENPEVDGQDWNGSSQDDFGDGFERTDSMHSTPQSHSDNNGEMHGFHQVGEGAERVQVSASVQVADRVSSAMQSETSVASAETLVALATVSTQDSVGNGKLKLTAAEEERLNQVVGQVSTSMIGTVSTPWWKRTIDIVGAGTGLIVLSPVLIGAAIAIKTTSPGPVFFRQQREGKGGKPFGILKFRTMVVDAEAKQASLRGVSEQDGPAFKLKDDPRITSVGKQLRKSCIDELPQLVNVLVGQMSLVGPRPLPVAESTECSPWQRMRLTVLPGLTCTWQARGGRNVSFDQWMRMDLDYIKNRGFIGDVRLIFETALIALLQRGSV